MIRRPLSSFARRTSSLMERGESANEWAGMSAKAIGLCAGRKLDGLRAPEIACEDPIAAWFAEAAWLEAASIGAFRRLARELRAHGAPAHLIASANVCARDEIRHARMMARLAE